jgi:hypothetical protein
MSDSFGLLPYELILHIALLLRLNHIINLCSTNSRFKEIILDEEYFWKQRCICDFGIENHQESWKTLYKNSINTNILVFGFNGHGQLGLGDHEDRDRPTQMPNLKGKQISSGREYTTIIDLNNNVWDCGCDTCGRLGLSDHGLISDIPTQIPNIKAK